MASSTVETEALEQAASALSTYIDGVNGCIERMKSAATDCADNMGNDVYSQKAIANLESCITALKKATNEAGIIRQKIVNKKNSIESSAQDF